MVPQNGVETEGRRDWRERLGRLAAAGMLGVLAVRPLFSSGPVSGGLIVLWVVLGLLIAGLVADWSRLSGSPSQSSALWLLAGGFTTRTRKLPFGYGFSCTWVRSFSC